MKIRYFKSGIEFRKWLRKNHHKSKEQWLGFFKKDSGKKWITYEEALNQALCYGWIDGLTRSIDKKSYSIRFTPRRSTSNWSSPNIKRVKELIRKRLMTKYGLALYKGRKKPKK